MELINVLAQSVTVFGETFDVSLNWIGNLIRWLCTSVGVVGVGIILFSLILKLITLPFDIYQRISMRKQNIQMKANQEKMEKLQKQYANDKDKYNQKVMEMYKENGISMFSSCLPMILSLVIFIVAINAFNAFAQYSNVENYNNLVDAYNAEMKTYAVQLNEENYDSVVSVGAPDANGNVVYTVEDKTTQGKFLYYTVNMTAAEHAECAAKTTAKDKIAYINARSYKNKSYFVDEVRAIAEDKVIQADVAAQKAANAELTDGKAVSAYLEGKAQAAVVKAYDSKVKENTKFGWIKNIWVTDASYEHPVLSAEKFATEAAREEFKIGDTEIKYSEIGGYTNAYSTNAYNHVTAKLTAQKESANGYFILIALSIGTILLQQFVMQRSQKEQQKYSSVDGMAGSQQKMTMIIMTGMFAIFSFMYSSAFSIYLITSNLFSMFSTMIINKLVDKKMEKKEEVASIKRYENHASERIEKAKTAGRASAQEIKKKK